MKLRKEAVKLNNEKGYTLAIVLMVLLVFSVLGMSVMAMSINSMKMSAGEREDQSVFYIAEAALNTEMAIIEQKVNEAYSNNKQEAAFYNSVLASIGKFKQPSTANFEKSSGHAPSAEITVVELNKSNPRGYKVTSTGVIGNKERIIEQEITIEWKGSGDDNGVEGVAIAVRNDILLDGKVTGDIITSKKAADTIEVGWDTVNYAHFEGTMYIPSGYKASALKLKQNMTFTPNIQERKEFKTYTLPPFPAIPTYPKHNGVSYNYEMLGDGNSTITLDKNSELGKLNIGGSHTLTLNIIGDERELVLNELELDGTGKIIVNGTGKLKIYVKNKLKINNGILNPRTPNEGLWESVNLSNSKEHLKKVEIFYAGTEEFSVNAQLKIYASIYTRTANVSISGSAGIFGNIFSGGDSFKVTGTGNVQPSLYFAPDADFEVSGSGKVQGTIIGNSIIIKGGGKVHYDPYLIDEGFFNPEFGNPTVPEVNKKQLIEL